MRTAYCFTPDRTFFPPAVRAIASLIEAEPEADPRDSPRLRARRRDAGLRPAVAGAARANHAADARFRPLRRRASPAKGVSRARCFAGCSSTTSCPRGIERIVSVDSDMLIVAPGAVAPRRLRSRRKAARRRLRHDLPHGHQGRRRSGAAVSAIPALARPRARHALFQRRADGDRPRRMARREADRARDDGAQRTSRSGFPSWSRTRSMRPCAAASRRLSPRYNFMGDFFLLDLERTIEPIVLHFVNAPKPWELASWRGEARFAENYRDWFAASPWPEWAKAPEAPPWRRSRPPRTRVRQDFAGVLRPSSMRRHSLTDSQDHGLSSPEPARGGDDIELGRRA